MKKWVTARVIIRTLKNVSKKYLFSPDLFENRCMTGFHEEH